MHTMGHLKTVGLLQNSIGIGRAAPHDDQMEVGRQQGQGLHGEGDVLALLDGAHVDDVAAGQLVAGIDLLQHVFADRLLKEGAARLVDELNLLGGHMAVVDDVATGALGDGYDAVGLFQGAAEFPGVDFTVYPFVVFGMAQEDEVVDGDHGADAAAADAKGKLAGESVIELHAVAKQVADDATGAPEK